MFDNVRVMPALLRRSFSGGTSATKEGKVALPAGLLGFGMAGLFERLVKKYLLLFNYFYLYIQILRIFN